VNDDETHGVVVLGGDGSQHIRGELALYSMARPRAEDNPAGRTPGFR